MKKAISFLLMFSLILAIALVPGYAYTGKASTAPGLEKKGGLPPGISKFIDLKEVEWARNAIEKMAEKDMLKGVAENKFAPNKPVTKAEALAMILRVLGHDEEAQLELKAIKEGKKKSKIKDMAQEWALGYIEIAKKGNLLADDEELTWKNLNKPAQRQEVAKYLVRAMGLEGEAAVSQDKPLPFKDAAAVKKAFRGYVYVAYDRGMMRGDNKNNFQPNKSVTRAEMAVLVEKLDEYKDTSPAVKTLEGILVEIRNNNKTLVLKVEDSMKYYRMDDHVKVYINNQLSELRYLEEEEKIKIYVENDKVIEIRWNSDTVVEGDVFEGVITAIDNINKKISVTKGNTARLFTIHSDTPIKINGSSAVFSDLAIGMDVKVTIKNDKVLLVAGTGSIVKYRGKITDINRDRKEISFKTGSTVSVYKVDEKTIIRIDGSIRDFERLEVGMEADIKAVGTTLQEILARNIRETLKGTLIAINRSIKEITIKSGSTERTLKVNEDAVIRLDGQRAALNDLMPEMEVEVAANNDKADRIDAYTVETQYRGELIEKYMGNPYRLVLSSNSKTYAYHVDRGVIILKNDDDDAKKFKDLKLGSQIEIIVSKGVVIKIRILED